MEELEEFGGIMTDPIECGHEAALGQWEARWQMLRDQYEPFVREHAELHVTMDRIEQRLPTGLPVGEKYIPRMADRITIQLELERAKFLVDLLSRVRATNLIPGVESADAIFLAEDIANMADGQPGWKS